MKALEIFVRRLFFWGSFVVGVFAFIEKVAEAFHGHLMPSNFTPEKLLEIASAGLLFAIVMQLHSIRLLLSSNRSRPLNRTLDGTAGAVRTSLSGRVSPDTMRSGDNRP